MRTLGADGAEGANMLALGDSVRALKRAGLEPDARRVASRRCCLLAARWPAIEHEHVDQQLICQSFLEMMAAERGAADNTLQAYRRDLDDFLGFPRTRRQSLPVAEPGRYFGPTCARSRRPVWRRRRARGGCRPSASYSSSSPAEGVIAEDPAHGFAGPKKGRALPKTLSVAEVDRLIEAAQRRIEPAKGRDRVRALRLYALIEMLYATGMRVSELVTLPRSVLAGDGRVLTIKGKGGRERLVPLNQAARAALDRYLNVGHSRTAWRRCCRPSGCLLRAARRGT